MKISNRTLLKAVFSLKGNFARGEKPSVKHFDGVEVAAFKNDAKAAVSISADFELSWAFRGRTPKKRDFLATRARRNFPYILKLLDDHKISITWATVGHLFLESCERGENGLAHPNMPRPPRNHRWKGDWYVHDPCTSLKADPLWYAPDLIQQIMERKTRHEIGTHSFSHIDFSPEFSNDDLVSGEIEKCILVMKPFGLKPKSLVFPFNKMGYSYLDVLSDLGITGVRYRDRRVRLSYPERTASGVYKIYESMNLRTPRYYDYLDKAKMFIDEAAKRHAMYHLWFHPSDPVEVLRSQLARIIEYISTRRHSGLLWVATISEVVAYCEAREKVNVQVQTKPNEVNVLFETEFDQEKFGNPEITLLMHKRDLPKKVFLEIDGRVRQRKPETFCQVLDGLKLMMNIPVAAKSLKLMFQSKN